MPNLIAYDVCGVQPMTGPTGLIFAMRAKAASSDGAELLVDEPDTGLSNDDAAGDLTSSAMTGSNPKLLNDSPAGIYLSPTGMTTAQGEALGDAAANSFAEMAFSIEKTTVTAVSRALKAEYTMELAQDLKAIHGLDAETELANILSSEILAEINREVVRTIYGHAKAGAQVNTTTAGTFDLDTDSNGRWSVEKFKGLLYQLERDANAIGQLTRRGKGNIIICSADVASALQMAGVLDYAPALSTNLNVDDTGNTFAGVLNGKFKYMLTHILRMYLQVSSMLLVIKVLHLMMLVFSIAHMFHYKWFVQLVKIHSNLKLVSRLVMAWFKTHLLQLTVLVH